MLAFVAGVEGRRRIVRDKSVRRASDYGIDDYLILSKMKLFQR